MDGNEWLALLLAGLAGLALGAFFYGSLWWSVQHVVSERQVSWLHVFGMPLRMLVALLCFFMVGAGHWQRLLACLVGMIVARLALAVLMHRSGDKEAGHAPQS